MHIFRTICTVLLLGAASPGFAAGLTDIYTSFWVLGDSLSDNGNRSVSTDGDVWNQPILDQFEAAGLGAGNFAYGGATARGSGVPGDAVVDLNGQLQLFAGAAPGNLGANPLVSLWIGGNDLRAAVLDPASAPAIGAETAGNIVTAIGTLALTYGIDDFLVFNLPDLALIPETLPAFGPGGPLFGLDPRDPANPVTSSVRQFNDGLLDAFDTLLPPGLSITTVDIFSLSQALFDDPATFGVDGLGPCFVAQVQVVQDCATVAYWDPIHPSSTIHDVVGETAIAALAPVPLPLPAGMLIAGLGALALLRRRT